MNIDELSRAIATETGDETLTRTVRDIIEGSNEGRFLFHGSKRSDTERLEEHGVEPRTPEGGYASYWTSGSRLFSSYPDRLNTIDTSFFHYLGNPMVLAISKRPDSEAFASDEVILIHDRVPYEDLQLLVVPYDDHSHDKRANRQEGERMILPMILDVVSGAYMPGTTRRA